jgi:hypothetical protein
MSNEITDRLISELQAAVKTETIEVEGRPFVTRAVYEVPLPRQPAAITIHSLSAVADYINNQLDYNDEAPFPFLVDIESPTAVHVANWLDETQRRSYVLESKALVGSFRFGQFMPIEDFIIGLSAQFAETDDQAKVLSIASNIADEAVVTFADDGIGQQVTAKIGVARIGKVDVPRIVTLRPFRTFKDVDRQPDGKFLFRLRRSEGQPPQAALYEADGGLWQNDAIAFIKSYLEAQIETGKAIIIG